MAQGAAAIGMMILFAAACEPAPAPWTSSSPTGAFQLIERISHGEVRVTGWAADRDVMPAATVVVVYVDGVLQPGATVADQPRPDVLAATGRALNSGYTRTLTVSDAAKGVCVSAVNQGAGNHTILGCRPVPPWNPLRPRASVTASQDHGLGPLPVTFDGTGSADPDGAIAGYRWDFGDGTTGVGATVTHTYTAPGVHTATLTVTDNDGLTATSARSITVEAAPTVEAAVRLDRAVGPVEAAFDGTGSADADGVIVGYRWDFGDGTTGVGAVVTHVYSAPGAYTATLTVTDNDGHTGTDAVTVPVDAAPSAAAISDVTSGLPALDVAFDGTGSADADGVIVGYRWDFGDGTTGVGATVAHTYSAPGAYTATLTVTDNDGHTGTDTASITVDFAPVAAAGALGSGGAAPLPVFLHGTGSTDADGTIAGYHWDFGDGTTGVGAVVTHTYTTPGTYTATLTVTDDDGHTDADTVTVAVSSGPNAVVAVDDVAGLTPYTATFDGTGSTDADGTIADYHWDFGDGTTGVGAVVTHTYTTPGTFTATLTVTDDDGHTDTASIRIEGELAPTAAAGASPTTTLTTDPVTFDAAGSTDADGTIVDYRWNFGDGTTGVGATVTHTYTTHGSYTATLTVTDDDGYTDTDTVTVEVEAAPLAVADTDVTSGPAPLTVTLDATNSSDADGAVTGYMWYTGDGTVTNQAVTTHTYTVPGTYTVTLVVTDDDGHSDTDTVTIEVEAPPVAVAASDATSKVAPSVIVFDAYGSYDPDGSIVSYHWNFGDGGSGMGVAGGYRYAAPGTYTVTLTVTDDDGNTATDTLTIIMT